MNFLKSKVSGLWIGEKKDDLSQLSVENPDGTASETAQQAEEYSKEERSSLWKTLSGKLGMDVTVGISLPVWLCEPTTVLTRMGEMLHFADLLNEAAAYENSLDRLAFVTVFAVTAYNGTDRFGKPFNPILGETYEYVSTEHGYRLFGEQVSHHPPISACHSEGENFIFYQETRPKTKFLGNSLELETQTKTHIYFPKTRDHFVYVKPPTTRVNNLIIGRMWIEHAGQFLVTNMKNGESCTLNFEKCGWLGKGRNEVSGYIKDANGKDCLQVFGKWSESMSIKWLYESGKEPKDTVRQVWKRPASNAIGKYKLTEFCSKLNEIDPEYEKLLPPTDSRLRPDRRALERGDMGEAAIMKQKMEDRQRIDKKNRAAKNEEWTPRWFKQIPEENGTGDIWVYCGDYWEQRDKKKELLAKETAAASSTTTEKEQQQQQQQEVEKTSSDRHGSGDGHKADEKLALPENEKDLLMAGPGISGLACDFKSY